MSKESKPKLKYVILRVREDHLAVIEETLKMDSESAAFDRKLREKIAKAAWSIEVLDRDDVIALGNEYRDDRTAYIRKQLRILKTGIPAERGFAKDRIIEMYEDVDHELSCMSRIAGECDCVKATMMLVRTGEDLPLVDLAKKKPGTEKVPGRPKRP